MGSILITGGAGFIGYHLARRCVEANFDVTILDCLDDFYDIRFKHRRLEALGFEGSSFVERKRISSRIFDRLSFIKGNIGDPLAMEQVFSEREIVYVVHLAARSGARDSFEQAPVYIENNITGFSLLLDFASKAKVKHVVYASSSSVYGASKDNASVPPLAPASLYGATKRAAEVLAQTYALSQNLPISIGRIFSTYGPMGRPDGLIKRCIHSIHQDQTIELFHSGETWRDFIAVEDVVEMLFRMLISPPPKHCPAYDIGTGIATKVSEVVALVEKVMKKSAKVRMVPKGRYEYAYSCAKLLPPKELLPSKMTCLEDGIRRLVEVSISKD